MKQSLQKRVALALAALALPALVGCGKSDAGSTSGTVNGNGSVIYGPNGQIIGGLPGGCVPITSGQPISFAANGIYYSGVSVVGGIMPRNGQTVGQVTVGTGGPGLGGPGIQAQRTGVDGSLSMSIQSGNSQFGNAPYSGYNSGYYPGYPSQSPTQAQAYGVLQISPATVQDILYQSGSSTYSNYWGGAQPYNQVPGSFPNSFYPGPYQQPNGFNNTTSQVCVSGIAFDLGVYQGTFYGGNVYVYLNGTSHGYALYF